MGSSSRKGNKKRKFYGNQHKQSTSAEKSETAAVETVPETPNKDIQSPPNASERKLRNNQAEVKPKDLDGKNFIVDMNCLTSVASIFDCPQCSSKALFAYEDTEARNGGYTEFYILCYNCDYQSEDCIPSTKKTGSAPDVNRRLIYAMRQLGGGHREASTFMSVMNLPPPPNQSAYSAGTKKILSVVQCLADEVMRIAAHRVRDVTQSPECGVSVDGTWQRRGYSSLNGVITTLSINTGEILDVEVLSKYCHRCQKWNKEDKASERYLKWEASHVCTANYSGSSSGMETCGATRIFLRSKTLRGLEYVEYYGDGDSKAFLDVCAQDPYNGKEIVKKECVGHYQKRLGTALRKLRKEEKDVRGKGNLTLKKVNKMQNYFGMALRSNTSSVKVMSEAIWSTFYHLAAKNEHPLHTKCPVGKESWCSYQKAVAAGRANQYQHKDGFPLEIIKHVKPVYERLTDEKMLEKCLHGMTQNANESFHGTIWKRCPKTKFAGIHVLKLSTYDAVIHFNSGSKVELEVLKRLGITPGHFMVEAIAKRDKTRISECARHSTPAVKLRRKYNRGVKKSNADKNSKEEGPTYASGDFPSFYLPIKN